MTNAEKEHYLSVLVELQLFNVIRAIREGNSNVQDIQREEKIKEFVAELPEYLSELPDVERKVRAILERTEVKSEEVKKLEREHDRKRGLGEER